MHEEDPCRRGPSCSRGCGRWSGLAWRRRGLCLSYGIERPPVLKLVPDQVRSGEHARLQVVSAPGTWGLFWSLERLQDGGTWNEVGALLGGPMKYQGKARFYLGDDAKNLLINDIGFTRPASIARHSGLEPGTYRLSQGFISGPPDRGKTLRRELSGTTRPSRSLTEATLTRSQENADLSVPVMRAPGGAGGPHECC